VGLDDDVGVAGVELELSGDQVADLLYGVVEGADLADADPVAGRDLGPQPARVLRPQGRLLAVIDVDVGPDLAREPQAVRSV